MTTYLFDTNIISYWEDIESPHYHSIKNKMSSLQHDDIICVSILTLYELQYGFGTAKEHMKENILKSIELVESIFQIIFLDREGSKIFGQIKSEYQKNIGIKKKELDRHNSDLMIASTAINENAVLVSNDKIFKNLSEIRNDFQYENWTLPRL